MFQKYKKTKKTSLGILIALLSLLAVLIIVICVNWFGILHKYYVQPKALKASAPYSASMGQVSPEDLAYLKTNPNYELATNSKGQVVFAHARKAFTDNKHENKQGRKALKKVYGLKHFSKTWYKGYIDKSKQLQVGDTIPETGETVTEEQVTQARHFGLILEIYSHSFKGVR